MALLSKPVLRVSIMVENLHAVFVTVCHYEISITLNTVDRSTQRENFQNYFVFDQNDFLTVTECYSVDN